MSFKSRSQPLKEYFEENPDMASLWGSNNDDQALEKGIWSNDKAWWVCKKHNVEYETTIYYKIRNPNSCSVCNGSKVFAGINDLEFVFPEIAKEWHPNKNNSSPSEVKYTSSKKAWWMCKNGHEWETRISHRTHSKSQSNCPQCNIGGAKPVEVISDKDDDLKKMFVSSPNGDANSVSRKSSVKALWKCQKDHQWQCSPRWFNGCPYCGNRVTENGEIRYVPTLSVHDFPKLAAIFDADKNVEEMKNVSYSSAKKLWWKCDNGHSYQSHAYTVYRSTEKGFTGCPHCSHKISSGEDEVYDFVTSITDATVIRSNRTVISPQELDIYIPSARLAIEYNGLYWHCENRVPSKSYHCDKWKMCKEKGVTLITIWEDDWRDHREYMESIIAYYLRVSPQKNDHLRPCFVDSEEAISYMSQEFLHGDSHGDTHIGLVNEQSNIVFVSAWSSSPIGLCLQGWAGNRFNPSYISGILDLVENVSREFNLEKLLAQTDNSLAIGDMFLQAGFSTSFSIPPLSTAVFGQRRTSITDGIDHNPEIVWDCGHTGWHRELSP